MPINFTIRVGSGEAALSELWGDYFSVFSYDRVVKVGAITEYISPILFQFATTLALFLFDLLGLTQSTTK
jgi:hypothetical protein